MRYQKLGSTDITVPRLSLGCVTFGREIDSRDSFAIMDYAYEKGINFFDTAESYGDGASETAIGEWFSSRGCRSRIAIASKVTPPYSPERIAENCDSSLTRLKVSHIDVYQLHKFDDSVLRDESLRVLEELIHKGKVRYIGVSNFTQSEISQCRMLQDELKGCKFSSIQNNYNFAVRDFDQNFLDFCEKEGIGTMSYSPLGAGFLTGKYDNEMPKGTRFDIKPGHRDVYFNDEGWQARQRLQSMSASTGIDVVKLALAWVFRTLRINTTLIGARSISHIDQALDALETDNQEAMEMLDLRSRGVRVIKPRNDSV